jgi:S1-C subfamily serine protease
VKLFSAQSHRQRGGRRRGSGAAVATLAVIAASLVLARGARSEDAAVPAPDTASGPAPRPLLEQLNRETEELYRDVGRGLLRVQLPPPRWPSESVAEDSPLTKYKGLDPTVRRELEQRRRRPRPMRVVAAEPDALARAEITTPAATRPAADTDVKLQAGPAVIVVPPPAPARAPAPAPAPSQSHVAVASRDLFLGDRFDAISPTTVPATVPAAPAFAPNSVGVLLDDRGHVLVPLYVDRDTASEQPIRLAGPGGQVVTARFVGSDRQTNLTVVQLPKAAGTPVRLADEPPRDGSLVLLVAPQDGSGRLGLWAGGGRDSVVVFATDGRCSGVARSGQFLGARACRLIAEQIIRHGSVKRATLGVIITVIPKDDPARQRSPLLGDRTAMRVDQVMPDSAAEKAGLKPGDLLLALAGEAVNDIPTLAAAIAARNGPTELQVLRGEQVLKIAVDLQQK